MTNERLSRLHMSDRADEVMRVLGSRAAGAPRRMRRSAVVAIAMVAVLAAATALAVGLNLSQRYTMARSAKQAVIEQYGLNEKTIELFHPTAEETDEGWTVVFDGFSDVTGDYTAHITRDGHVQVSWTHDDVDPAVYADGSPHAKVWGAKQLQHFLTTSNEEALAQIAAQDERRAAQTGEPAAEAAEQVYVDGVLLHWDSDQGRPDGAKKTAAEVVQAANAAITERYGLSARSLRLFAAVAVYNADEKLWMVDYHPWIHMYSPSWQLPSPADMMGDYQVLLADADGTASEVTWTLEGTDTATCTRETLGTATAYNAQSMEWLADTMDALWAVYGKYAEDETLWPVSVEDNAAGDEAMRRAGFSGTLYNHVLPQEGDLSIDEAKELFYQALAAEYGVTREVFNESVYAYAELTQQEGYREWYFWLQNRREQWSWSATINAETGEILNLWSDPFAFSNG